MDLTAMLAAVRNTESGSHEGDYRKRGDMVNGQAYYGAYQMPVSAWRDWTRIAGIAGADMRSEAAQDRVAASIMQLYYDRFGSWELAAVAWFAGPQEAAKMVRRGYSGSDSIKNPKIRDYVKSVTDGAAWASENPAFTRKIPYQMGRSTPSNTWVHPVAGKSKYSNSFYVPRDNNKTGIHGAIDVYAKEGTPIVAPIAGKVTSVKTGELGGYTAKILGDDGVTYYFAHMASAAVVNQGDTVRPGEHIGYVGASGNAQGTSPHLHLSMRRNGNLVNPFTYLEQSASVGPLDRNDLDDMEVPGTVTGMSGTMNSWLQHMSDQVRAGATAEVPTDEGELEDKKMQQEMV